VRLALVGAVAAVTVVLAGCGGSGGAQSRRAAVDAYFLQVDHAEQALLGSTGQIDQTFHQYSLTRITPAELRQLAFAQRAIGATLVRLRAITPPPAARPIHADLLRLTVLQYRVAHELAWTARYLPALAQALAPVGAAGRALGHGISTASATTLKPAETPSASPGGAVWTRAGCASCHTLAAAGATGTAGPDLDLLHPTAAQVAAQVRAGGPGMPSFATALSAAQVSALASFVASSESAPPSTTAVLDAFAAAFVRYGGSLRAVRADLDRLVAPPVLRPTWLAERRLLSQGVALCATIGADLARRDVAAANAAIRRLFLAVATGTSAARDRRAAAAAVRAYDAQLTSITALSAAVARARVVLARKLG
jgi:mono/diheme cytochrome c family protein